MGLVELNEMNMLSKQKPGPKFGRSPKKYTHTVTHFLLSYKICFTNPWLLRLSIHKNIPKRNCRINRHFSNQIKYDENTS